MFNKFKNLGIGAYFVPVCVIERVKSGPPGCYTAPVFIKGEIGIVMLDSLVHVHDPMLGHLSSTVASEINGETDVMEIAIPGMYRTPLVPGRIF